MGIRIVVADKGKSPADGQERIGDRQKTGTGISGQPAKISGAAARLNDG